VKLAQSPNCEDGIVRALFTDNTTLQFRAHQTLDTAFEAGRSVAMAHGVVQQHHALPSVRLIGGYLDQLIGPSRALTPTETWQNW
jgi:hypothetical protein